MNTLCIVLLVSLTGYVRSVAVGETCGTPTPACDPNLYCENTKCKVKADMACTTDPADQCIMGATCVNSKCKCGPNHTPSADMTKCLKNIDQACTAADDDCVHGATCVVVGDAGTCTCDADTMVPKVDKSMCLLKIGENCSAAGSMCIEGTACKEQTCMCPAKSKANTAMDKCLMYVGEGCAEKSDCVGGNTDSVVCGTDKKCACAAMYAPNDMMSMCKLKLNETCSGNDDCGMNAMCSSTKCACKDNYVNEENRCGMKVGGACTENENCVMNAECNSDRKCACKGTYTTDGDFCKSGSAAVVASLLLLVAALVTSRLV